MSAPARHWGGHLREGGAHFALWAPAQARLALRAGGRKYPMQPHGDGWFTCATTGLRAGDAYHFVLEDGRTIPDPAARAQMGDVHGPSKLVDPAYRWQNPGWQGRPWAEAVIYELHTGTFTPDGTFRAAIPRLAELAELGITAIELMPVAQFPGNRGWGYDGVLPYAVHPAYGHPDDLRALVDAAHGLGLMVLLDVVYNHFGPEGNYLALYAPDFFDPDRQTPWGAGIAWDQAPVRRFFIDNALYWLEEYRLDGLRLDAVDQISDPSQPDILTELAQAVRARFDREVHLTTEDNRNITRLHERDGDRVPLYTAEWNDDWHNAAHVIATGETAGYYRDFADNPHAHLARAMAEGFAWQGETSPGTGAPRGQASAHLPPAAFVDFLQNHDQTGNRALGERIDTLADPHAVRALRAMLLLSPHVPLLFMGEEYGETRPFLFFTDFHGQLADAVRRGRRREFAQFGFDAQDIPDPNSPETFAAARLDWPRRTNAGAGALAWTRSLLAVRAHEVTPHLGRAGGHAGRVLPAAAGVIAVEWALDGAALSLTANLSDRPAPAPPATGRLIWGEAGDTLAPWQVRARKAAP